VTDVRTAARAVARRWTGRVDEPLPAAAAGEQPDLRARLLASLVVVCERQALAAGTFPFRSAAPSASCVSFAHGLASSCLSIARYSRGRGRPNPAAVSNRLPASPGKVPWIQVGELTTVVTPRRQPSRTGLQRRLCACGAMSVSAWRLVTNASSHY